MYPLLTLLELRMMEMVVTAAALRCVKLLSDVKSLPLTNQQSAFCSLDALLLPKYQYQSTEGKVLFETLTYAVVHAKNYQNRM